MHEKLGESRGKAVALRYFPEVPAPFLVAKGEGRMAERLLQLAGDHSVPVLSDAGLIDLLYPIDLGDFIPLQLYEIIAKVFAFVRSSEES